MILVSPTEPSHVRRDMKVSSRPELYGVDFLWAAGGRLWGVQRKRHDDLIHSVQDGRLALELQQMRALGQGIVCVVGKGSWTIEGQWMGRERWSKDQEEGVLWSCMARGVWVDRVDDDAEFSGWLAHLEAWTRKEKHGGLTRPGATAQWGTKANDREWLEWFVQGWPGIGGELAKRIVEKYGCPVELKEGVELESVDGIGKVKAEKIRKVMGL